MDQNMNIFQVLEQMEAMLRDLAPVLWSYKENLKKQGFTEEQSYQMALAFQNSIINNSKDVK